MIELSIVTTPPGATIVKDGIVQEGVSPTTISMVKKNKEVTVVAQLAGYEDYTIILNPLESLPKDHTLKVPFRKLPRGAPIVRPLPRPGPDAGSAEPPPNRTGGELTGYPGDGSAVVPKTP
jgi:hypothetical protein